MVAMSADNLQEENAVAAPEQLVELLDAEKDQEYVFMQRGEDADFWDDDDVLAETNGI